jgi:hypothetical protein
MVETRQSSGNNCGDAPKTVALAGRFIAAIVCFVIINALVYLALEPQRRRMSMQETLAETIQKSPNRTFSWWMAKAYQDEKQPTDVALIGSSQMGSASFAADAQTLQRKIDVLTHRRVTTLENDLAHDLGHPVSVFNCSQGGFMMSDAYLMSRALFDGKRKPKVVLIGVAPRDFMDNSLAEPSATEPFQFYGQAVPLGRLSRISFADPLSRLRWLMSNDLPLRWLKKDTSQQTDKTEEDEEAAAKHTQNQVVQALSDISGDLKPGILLIPANIPRGLQDNTNEYAHRYRGPNRKVYDSEMIYFKELLSYFHNAGVKVIVVGMPILWPTREMLPEPFWKDFRSAVAQACSNDGARWFDMSDSPEFDANDFLDTVHLNAGGGAKLFQKLADIVAHDREIAVALGGQAKDATAIAGTHLPQ